MSWFAEHKTVKIKQNHSRQPHYRCSTFVSTGSHGCFCCLLFLGNNTLQWLDKLWVLHGIAKPWNNGALVWSARSQSTQSGSELVDPETIWFGSNRHWLGSLFPVVSPTDVFGNSQRSHQVFSIGQNHSDSFEEKFGPSCHGTHDLFNVLPPGIKTGHCHCTHPIHHRHKFIHSNGQTVQPHSWIQ